MRRLGYRWGFILASGLLLGAGRPNPNSLEQFRWDQEPKKSDWRYFIKAAEADREKLWSYHVKAGHALGQWSWGWRLGWVRTCSESKADFCGRILRSALFDKALVVRGEAATRFGRRFDGSGNADAVTLLADAYRNEKNTRNGTPLYVQERILFALHEIGGAQAAKAGLRLAATHPTTTVYWKKLEPSD